MTASTASTASAADELTALALMNCLIREVARPHGRVRTQGSHVLVELPGTGRTLRAALRRPGLAEPRLTGRVEEAADDGWSQLSWQRVTALVQAELATSGRGRSPLADEIAASHAFISEVLLRRPAPASVAAATGFEGRYEDYLASEQSLIAGHRHHPAPKARSGEAGEALRYAPETRAAFRLRWLAVPDDLLWQREVGPGSTSWAGPRLAATAGRTAPDGHHLLPVHPWQYSILGRSAALSAALTAGRLLDLGECGERVRPTSSVRTVDAAGRAFLKLSLSVQITNCLRVNRRAELAGAVAVTRLIEPVMAELATLFGPVSVLGEPVTRSVDLPELGDQLGVVVREPLGRGMFEDARPVLAAALAEPWPDPSIRGLLARSAADRDRLVAWWDAYLALLVPPVLHAFLEHGVVFEAHLQNVVVGLADAGAIPARLVLRDLEGVKLTGPRFAGELAALPRDVRAHLRYGPERGWDRVAYCLFVNHVSAVLGVLADLDPGAERLLWSRVRAVLTDFVRAHGRSAQVSGILAGVPLPAKTNLLTRWHRAADRDSGYVPVALPLGPPVRGGDDRAD
jgi:siderophore synthetase component